MKDMKKITAIVSLAFLALFMAGCRRVDERTFTVVIPALKEADKAPIVEALAKYGGIDKGSYVWDFEKKTLTLRYDSMQIAKTNIRMAIEEKGIKVKWENDLKERR